MIRPISPRLTVSSQAQPIQFYHSLLPLPKSSTQIESITSDALCDRNDNRSDAYVNEPTISSTVSLSSTANIWNMRAARRFGNASDFMDTPSTMIAGMSLSKLLPALFSANAEQIANEIMGYIKSADRDIKGTQSMVKEAIGYGRNPELSCVFMSRAMTEIFDNKNTYNTLDDFFTAVSQRQSELIACLSIGKKLKYGSRIQSLLARFQEKKPLLDGLSRIYANHIGIKVGTAGAELMAYFFRPDTLSSKSIEIFDRIFQLLDDVVSPQSTWFA